MSDSTAAVLTFITISPAILALLTLIGRGVHAWWMSWHPQRQSLREKAYCVASTLSRRLGALVRVARTTRCPGRAA